MFNLSVNNIKKFLKEHFDVFIVSKTIIRKNTSEKRGVGSSLDAHYNICSFNPYTIPPIMDILAQFIGTYSQTINYIAML